MLVSGTYQLERLDDHPERKKITHQKLRFFRDLGFSLGFYLDNPERI